MENNNHLIDVQTAKAFIAANWPNDPLLKQIVFNLLDKLPTVDAVEVVHGMWDKYEDDKVIGYDAEGRIKYRKVYTYYCGRCGRGTAVKTNYCPNCGADMR